LRIAKSILLFFVHLALATVFAANIATIIVYTLGSVLLVLFPHFFHARIPSATVYFIVQMAVAAIAGYSARLTSPKPGSIALFVWIIPLLWFLFRFLGWNNEGSVLTETRWQHFILSGATAARKSQLTTTLPLLSSLAYSLGALVQKKLEASKVQGSVPWSRRKIVF